MSLEKALKTSMESIPECLAAGYIDMETGMLLGVKTTKAHSRSVLETLAAATADLFQGQSIAELEAILKAERGSEDDSPHYFYEIIVFSKNLLHVFMRTKKYPEHVVCYICRKSANPGMVLAKSKMGLESVSAAV